MLSLTSRHSSVLPAMLTAVVSLAGCKGGGDATSPEVFPDAAGIYRVSGYVDGDPHEESSLGGTVTLTQASLTSGTLRGTGTVTGSFLAGLIVTMTDDAIAGTISTSGDIRFTLYDASNKHWTFSGKLLGNSIQEGRHRLDLGDGGWIPGDWTGRRD